MRRLALLLTAGLALGAAPAAAQSWGGTYDGGYRAHDSGHGQRSWNDDYRSNAVPSNFDWRSQLDRPGDYRCDAFWDAGRTDCGARWRDQRHHVSPRARHDYRGLAGYGRGDYDSYDGHGYGHGYSRHGHGRYDYSSRHRGHGPAYAYGHAQGSTTWHGAYGRPDHVYPGGGVSYGGYSVGYGGGYGSRSDWCRANYRSYDPSSGYYRAYSGRLVYCG